MSETATEEAPAQPEAAAGRAEPGVRLPVAVLAVVATVVVALLLMALVVRLDADRLPTAPPRDPPAPPVPPVAATRFTVVDRQLSLEEFSVTLAGPPFTCTSDVVPPPTGLAQVAACSFVVHEDYDGKGSDWGAQTGVALLADGAVSADLRRTTSDVFDLLASALYDAGDRARFTKQSDGPAQVPAPSGSAWTQQADVRVRRAGLPTPYDRLVVIVVRLEGGRHVAFFSDFPHDGSKRVLQAVVDSVGTLEARP